MKALRFLIPLLVFLGIGIFLYSGLYKDPRFVPSPLIDKAAPAFSLPELRDGTRVVASAALLGKPYLLNVWGSWCVACREEHATVMQLTRSGVVDVIGLNWKDDPNDAKEWLQRFGDPYAQIAQDRSGRTAIDFGVYGAPESFLIDPQGVIRYKHVGPLTPDIIEKELKPRLAVMQTAKP